jgi:hypothetical protein
LLEIIRQGAANRNQAELTVTTLTTTFNEGVANQQELTLTISQQENRLASIKSAISGANGNLDTLTGQLSGINGQI